MLPRELQYFFELNRHASPPLLVFHRCRVRVDISHPICHTISAFNENYDSSPTFADGTRTRPSRGLGLRTYVLARFSSSASFEWVKRARSFLVKTELKYRDLGSAGFDLVLARFPSYEAADLGRLLIREASTATIFLADSESYAQEIVSAKLKEGAEYAYDFGIPDVIRETAEQMIRDIPLYRLKPYEISEVIEPFSAFSYRFKSRTRFNMRPRSAMEPPRILQQIGGKLRDAEVFAARAYCLLDVGDRKTHQSVPEERLYSRLTLAGRGVLESALAVPMVFDRDHAASIVVLNESIHALQRTDLPFETNFEQLIREEDSRAVDALQAADIAAGFARDLLDRKGLRALAAQFRRVLLNGVDLHRLKVFN
jgi:hypothetical protein